MRICLIGAANDGTCQLASGLARLGHSVDVVGFEPLVLPGDLQEFAYYQVEPKPLREFKGMLRAAAPAVANNLQEVLAIWEKIFELHSKESFDLIDCGDRLTCSIMPEMALKVPIVVNATAEMKIFIEPAHSFEKISFQQHLLAMLERISLVLADAIVVPSESLRVSLSEKQSLSPGKVIVQKDFNAADARARIYLTAITLATAAKQLSIYLRPPELLGADALMIFEAFDQMIYNYLYQNSYRFRLYHWWCMWRQQPSLFLDKFKRRLKLAPR